MSGYLELRSGYGSVLVGPYVAVDIEDAAEAVRDRFPGIHVRTLDVTNPACFDLAIKQITSDPRYKEAV